MTTCIVLNADYTFLNLISVKKALTLLSKDKVDVLKYADEKIKTSRGWLKIPAVLRLIKLIRTIYKARVPFSKRNVMVRDGFKCVYCGKRGMRLTIDHIVPKARGGKSTFENCVASCKPCNTKKGHKSCQEARMYPKTNAVQPTIMQFLQLKMKTLGIDKVLNELYSS